MGYRDNQLMAQQIQETVDKIGEEGGKLSRINTVFLLYYHL